MATIWLLSECAETWFSLIANASLYGGLAICFVLLISKSKLLDARYDNWLWRIAFAKLLLAGLWLAPVNLPWLPNETVPLSGSSTASTVTNAGPATSLTAAAPPTTNTIPPEASLMRADANSTEPLALLSVLKLIKLRTWLMFAWATGFILGLIRFGRRWLQMVRLLASVTPVENPDVLRRLGVACHRQGVNRLPALSNSRHVDGPCLVGIVRPTIVLPESSVGWSEDEWRVALSHEIAHLRRRDLIWNWLPAWAQIVFFFHPLVWIACRCWSISQEIATDEQAVRAERLNPGIYAEGLIALGSRNVRQDTAFGVALGSTFEQLTTRLVAMQRIGTPDVPRLLIATVFVVALTGLVPWQLTAQSVAQSEPTDATDAENGEVKEPATADPAIETKPVEVTTEQRDADVSRLRRLGAKVRFFHKETHPDHWVQIQLIGNAFDDEHLESVKRISVRSTTSLHIKDTYIAVEGMRLLRGANIRSLALSGVDIDDECMFELRHLPNLTWLQVSGAELTDQSVVAIAACRAIKRLRLSGTRFGSKFTDEGLAPLKDLATLRKLELGETFSPGCFDAINQIPNLEGLEIGPNVSNDFLKQLTRLPFMTELSLRGPNINDETAKLLADSAGNLKTAYLRSTQITDVGVAELARLSNLETLTLSHTTVTDAAISKLGVLKNLRWLDLEGSPNITDESLKSIGQFPRIRMLFLMSNAITSEGLEHLRDAADTLGHLDLQDTDVTTIPKWLKDLKRVYISTD